MKIRFYHRFVSVFLVPIILFSCEQSRTKTIKGLDLLPVSVHKTLDSLKALDALNLNTQNTLSLLYRLDKNFSEEKFSEVHAFMNSYKSKCYFVVYDLDSAQIFSKKTCDYFQKNQDVFLKQYVDAMQLKGLIYREKSDIVNAKKTFEETLYLINANPKEYETNPKSYDFLGQFYGNLANLYGDEREYKKARVQIKKALNYYGKSTRDVKRSFAVNYLNLGVNFEYERLDSAIFYVKKAINLISPQDSMLIIRGYEYAGEFYLQSAKADSAIKYFNKALIYSNALGGQDSKSIYHSLNSSYDLSGNKIMADKFYYLAKNKALTPKEENLNFEDISIAKNLLKYATKSKKIQDIDTLSTHFMFVSDTVYNDVKAKALKDLEIKYEVKAKNDNIEKLRIENDLKDSQLRQRTALLLLLLLSGVIVYFIYRQRRLKQENEKSELEQRFLRSQMNPHFMSNALSAIQAEILEGKSKLANHYLNKYSELTRMIFENSKDKFIPIYREIKVIENYLLLQKIRFGDKFDYTLNLYDEIEYDSSMIPPMLIQPSIENAIEHGFMNIDYKGLLSISIIKNSDSFIATVQDNGIGLKKLSNENNKKSLSSSITKDRLVMLAKETKIYAGIDIKSILPQGVQTTLTIPITI